MPSGSRGGGFVLVFSNATLLKAVGASLFSRSTRRRSAGPFTGWFNVWRVRHPCGVYLISISRLRVELALIFCRNNNNNNDLKKKEKTQKQKTYKRSCWRSLLSGSWSGLVRLHRQGEARRRPIFNVCGFIFFTFPPTPPAFIMS